MNILYVHGLASSGASGTARNLQKYLPDDRIVAPDFPINPDKALALIRKTVEDEKIDLIIGTSMGGMLAQKVRGVKKILVNPAMHVSELLRTIVGTAEYLSRRQDGTLTFEITPEICDRYEALEATQYDNISISETEITVGLFGKHGDVVDCSEEFDRKYAWVDWFDGGHRLSEENVRDCIAWFVDRMRGLDEEHARLRERGNILWDEDFNDLRDI